MSKMFYGQINMSDLHKAMKAAHTAFKKVHKKTTNEDIVVCGVVMWLNDEPDKYGNTVSIHLNSTENAPAEEKARKVYIANLKPNVSKEKPLTQSDMNIVNESFDQVMNNMPIAQPTPNFPHGENGTTPPPTDADDLPF